MPWFLHTNQDFSGSLNGIKGGNKLKQKQKKQTNKQDKQKNWKKKQMWRKDFLKKYLN